MTADDDEIVGIGEIAERTGVSKQAVNHWTNASHMQFPKPVADLSAGRIWRWGDVRKWLDNRKKGQQK